MALFCSSCRCVVGEEKKVRGGQRGREGAELNRYAIKRSRGYIMSRPCSAKWSWCLWVFFFFFHCHVLGWECVFVAAPWRRAGAGLLGAAAWCLAECQRGIEPGEREVMFPSWGWVWEPSNRQREREKERESESGRGLSLDRAAIDMLPSPPLPHSTALIQLSASLYYLVGM